MKFQSLKPADTAPVIPWLIQVSMRQDDLQCVLQVLQGNTVWNLLGLQLKPHTLPLSKQAVALKTLLGKGTVKGSNKGKAAGKGKVGTTTKSSPGP